MEKDFVAKRIASIRTGKNLSARGLSLDLGKSRDYIFQCEAGKLNPPLDFISDFCEHFKIPIGEFFDQDVKYPMRIKNLAPDLDTLNNEEYEQVLSLVKLLANKKR